MNYAPIAIFVYKRPDHTRRTIEALVQCPEFAESPLYVFCDGAKKPEDQAAIDETRAVVRLIVGERATMIEAAQNQGLANSIIAGVSKLLDEFDRVIVLEDDLIVSPGFLQYMNMALEAYQDEPSVMQVSGYMFPVPEFVNRTEAMFLPFTVSWGWATWKRAWAHFDPLATGWEVLQTDREMRSRFDLDDSYEYFNMMKRQIAGEVDSWAIRWYWSVFKNKGCTLFPPVSHVNNIGFDGSGSHGWLTGWLLFKSKNELMNAESCLPKTVLINKENYEAVKRSIASSRSKGISILKNIKTTLTSIGK
jgi:hypothetical protein